MADQTAGDSMDQDNGDTQTGGDQQQQTPRTFSQDDVDRIVRERLARAKAEPPADYEDLKTKAAEFDKLQEAQKSELERERDAREKAEQRAAQVEAEAKEARLMSAILAEAAKADRKVVDPEAVLALIDRGSLDVGENGVPSNIAEAVDSLLEKRPYLVAQEAGTRGSADQGARQQSGTKQVTEAELKRMTPEQIVAARKDGRLADLLGSR